MFDENPSVSEAASQPRVLTGSVGRVHRVAYLNPMNAARQEVQMEGVNSQSIT